MKTGDVLVALKEFFLDVIGAIIPGALMLFGGSLLISFSAVEQISPRLVKYVDSWAFVIGGSYIIGNGVLGIGHHLGNLWAYAGNWRLLSWALPSSFSPEREVLREIQGRDVYRRFRQAQVAPLGSGEPPRSVKEWRSVAMTIAKGEKHVVYRFMFISLFHRGVATTLTLLPAAWLFFLLTASAFPIVSVYPLGGLGFTAFATVSVLISLPFWDRNFQFYARAMRVPFAMALQKLTSHGKEVTGQDEGRQKGIEFSKEEGLSVYLAGGFRSGWQEQLLSSTSGINFYDPRTHKLDQEDEYTAWDLLAVRKSDLIFAYAEASNPSLYGLSVEVGYAKALGKTIIFIDEKSKVDPEVGRYLGMIRSCADVVFESFEDGLEYFKTLSQIGKIPVKAD